MSRVMFRKEIVFGSLKKKTPLYNLSDSWVESIIIIII